APAGLDLKQWLLSFPSYGFLLSVRPDCVRPVQALFRPHELICAEVGQVTGDRALMLTLAEESLCFWDLAQAALTGFGG
ncbi:MAG: hypothetical protein HC873_19060, partial [Leptolyngbyaceae cyanobacterium SL_1_1]|nr:hypothetical protein [Leptolyngbyaceae cyanobacterium SL_1_1]